MVQRPSPPDSIGFAILGAGMIAEYHAQAVRANADRGARLVSIAYHNPDRYAAIEDQFGVPVTSQEAMLADPAVDVVCICTPSGQHPQQALNAAQAGKHVLVEKPMALNPTDASTMIAACDAAGVKLGVTYQSRTMPIYQRIHAAIEAGDLGDLTLGVVTMPFFRPPAYYAQAAWRGTWAMDGGGVLMNQGIHQIDLLVWLMGDPVSVEAHAGTLHRAIEVEDTLAATLRFGNGALATVTATTTVAPGYPHRIEVYGTKGGIRTEGHELVAWALAEPEHARVEPLPVGGRAEAGGGADPRGIKADGHIALFRDFIAAIREGRSPMIGGVQGKRSVDTVYEIYRAAGLVK